MKPTLKTRTGLLPVILSAWIAAAGAPASAQRSSFDPVHNVGWTQKLNTQVPGDLTFTDESRKTVRLGDYLSGKRPVVLNMIFYKCPGVCTMELDGMVKAFNKLKFDPGRDFEVVTVSIDPKETPALAADKKEAYFGIYRRPQDKKGWHFLVGQEAQIERLATAVGFRYTYDEKANRFSHPAGIVLLTPNGKISRYFITTVFAPKDLRLALVEASAYKIGSPVDKLVLLTCLYGYDPHTGKYGLFVFRAVQLGGFITLLLLGSFMTVMFLKDRRNKPVERGALAPQPTPSVEGGEA